jgi:anti-sigma factor RsiW
MHQPVRDGLEDYLAGKPSPTNEFGSHLKACPECAAELGILSEQARLVRVLHGGETAEPAPGFYARVLNRIERRVKPSVWALLLEPALGRPVAVASAALALLVSAYIVSTEPFRMTPGESSAIVAIRELSQQDTPAAMAKDRDVVLASLASFQDN